MAGNVLKNKFKNRANVEKRWKIFKIRGISLMLANFAESRRFRQIGFLTLMRIADRPKVVL